MAKQNKVTKSARLKDCEVRFPGYCNFNPETSSLAHLPIPGQSGTGMKPLDIHAVYACSTCHDIIDHRIKTEFTPDEIRVYAFEGMVRTQALMIAAGLIEVNY